MNRTHLEHARATGAALLLFATLLFGAGASPNLNAAPGDSISIVPTISNISIVDGELVASGTVTATIHGRTTTVPFTAPVNLSAVTNGPGAGACPILDLELGPIALNLLGLVVETSPICLQITAYEAGGLLGDLLCAVANLLAGGLTLDQILDGVGLPGLPGLTPAQINALLGGITNLLNAALVNLLDAIVDSIIDGIGGGACDILHLELGPLNLNLLGLEVILDDCEGGPVVVDITGQRGRGNLLGNLLCGLLNSGRVNLGTTLGELLELILRP